MGEAKGQLGTDTLGSEKTAEPAKRTPIIGIGASAGGLEALESLFDGLPTEGGAAYVVVQHLSPDFKSMMDELLARHTTMPIQCVEHGMTVQPNHVYLIPPKKEMTISGARLLLSDRPVSPELNLPIDAFFHSLARERGATAVAVVLSGTGRDGSRGAQSVHHCGGLVLAQKPDTAQFEGMPQSVIDTGTVDLVLNTKDMGAVIVDFAKGGSASSIHTSYAESKEPIDRLFGLLNESYDIDFSCYRTSTVARRIDRRVQYLHEISLKEYVDRLAADDSELDALYQDLLIGVTRFFRDPEAYDALKAEVLPRLFERERDSHEIRIWATACATGCEPYSLAILLDEEAQRRDWRGEIKIFATDVHQASIEQAGLGVYSPEQVKGVSASRLNRYFVLRDDQYQIAAPLRKSVVFASHNLMRDPPFTNLDLITCRNMLIYLQPEAQRKVIALLHYGLKCGGHMMLGPSESPGELQNEFDVVHNHWRIFSKRRDVRLTEDLRQPLRSLTTAGLPYKTSSVALTPRLPERQVIAAYEQLAKKYIPPTFIIKASGELIYSTAGAGAIVQRREGFSQNNLLSQVGRDLRLAISGLLKRVGSDQQAASYQGIKVETVEGTVAAHVTVAPIQLTGIADANFMVTIEHQVATAAIPHSRNGEVSDLGAAESSRAEHVDSARLTHQFVNEMESELQDTRESLQSSVEQMEATNEELQATNEELIASNEELQSTNEELHSVNEELYTVNIEHQRKIDELTEVTEDLDNLVRSTDAATMFLDNDLRLRRFGPAAKNIFRVLQTDIGRKLDTFAHTLVYDDLFADLQKVLKTRTPIEHEVIDVSNTHYMVRILPYESRVGAGGIILSLIDLTQIRSARADLEASERKFRGTFENAAVGIAHVALDGSWLDVNQRLCDIVGYKREELLKQQFQDITHDEDIDGDMRRLQKLIRGEVDRYSMQKRYIRKNGRDVWINLTVSLQRDSLGDPMYCITVVQDISPRKRFEQELKTAIRQRDRFLATLSHELRNPLSALLHAARLMKRTQREEQDNKHLQVVLRQADQVSRLLDDLLDVSRVTQNKIVLTRTLIDLKPILLEATDAIQPLIDAASHKLDVLLPADPVWVQGDRTRILQVLENLLNNASKYTPPGGIIELKLETNDDEAVIAVTDNGLGLTANMLQAVFDMFVQSESSRDDRQGGMGLGLTLVKSLVELHEGTVSARSSGPNQGSTFEVRLPTTDLRPAEEATEEATEQEVQSRERLGVVLIVEDQPDSREMLAEILRLDGYEVLTASDGDQGLATILSGKPDVALVDIDLPGLSGLQIARQVRKTLGPADVSLVALTGFGRATDRSEAIEAGFDEHLVKPVSPEDLYRVLTKPVESAKR